MTYSNNNDTALRWVIERTAAVAATAMGSSPPNVVPLHPTADSAEYEDVFRRFRDGAQMGDAIRLDGLIAIITGGAGGIGGATARLMAARGAWVVVADISADSAHSLADEPR